MCMWDVGCACGMCMWHVHVVKRQVKRGGRASIPSGTCREYARCSIKRTSWNTCARVRKRHARHAQRKEMLHRTQSINVWQAWRMHYGYAQTLRSDSWLSRRVLGIALRGVYLEIARKAPENVASAATPTEQGHTVARRLLAVDRPAQQEEFCPGSSSHGQ